MTKINEFVFNSKILKAQQFELLQLIMFINKSYVSSVKIAEFIIATVVNKPRMVVTDIMVARDFMGGP